MVVVTVELWPGGDKAQARGLGVMTLANDGTGTAERGNYTVALAHAGKFWGKPGAWKSGAVSGFLRKLSPYHLVFEALKACLMPNQANRNGPGELVSWLESFEERAAIMEYEAGLPRDEAERKALEVVGPPPSKGANR